MRSKEKNLTDTNSMRKKNRVHSVIFGVICFILIFGLAPEIIISSYSTSAARKVRSLLSPRASLESLPQEVTLTMDGNTTTINKNADSYRILLALLRLIHSEDARKKAGEPPFGFHRVRCGELAIRHLGLPFHCELYRSTDNTNYLFIAIPYGNNRPGHALPWILDNNKLGTLARSQLPSTSPDRKSTITSEQGGGEDK